MGIDTAIVTAAGLGTRMLPFSKEVPKEMLPIIVKFGHEIQVIPALHYIFNALFDAGVRKFIFVVSRGKRLIEDYFTPDWSFVEKLLKNGKNKEATILENFYRRLELSLVVTVTQPQQKGFGDAVLKAEDLLQSYEFIVHAGDDLIYPNHAQNLENMLKHWTKYKPDALLLYEENPKPSNYGVIVGEESDSYLVVKEIIEKPKKPPSNKIVIAIYLFTKDLFKGLEQTKPMRGEHQLTDAINYLIASGATVHALRVKGLRLDLGTPSSYLRALSLMVRQQ